MQLDDDEDDDVIFLECDNKDLDLEGSQMALFEKIRQNIKIKKEKVDSQEVCEIVNIASPQRISETEDVISLSPESFDDDKTYYKDRHDQVDKKIVGDNIINDKCEVASLSPISDTEMMSPLGELPDLNCQEQIDHVFNSPQHVTHDDGKAHRSATKQHLPQGNSSSSPSKRQAQFIDPLPQPPRKANRRAISENTVIDMAKQKVNCQKRQEIDRLKQTHERDNKYSYVNFSLRDKERRAEVLKDIELRKKVQKQKESHCSVKTSNDSSQKPSASSRKIKMSQPKLSKLLPEKHSLREVDLFGDKPLSAPRQPVRRSSVHTPTLAITKAKKSSNVTSSTLISAKTTAVSLASNNLQLLNKSAGSELRNTEPRRIAETTLDG